SLARRCGAACDDAGRSARARTATPRQARALTPTIANPGIARFLLQRGPTGLRGENCRRRKAADARRCALLSPRGLPAIEKPTQEAQNACWMPAGDLELHLFETLEQGLGVLLVAGLARVVGAQRHAAHAGQLLRRDLGILIALELVPEAL